MRTILLTLTALLTLAITACHTKKMAAQNDTPLCIREKIKAAEADPQHARIKAIYRYMYKGEAVYYMVAGHCNDCFNQVYTSTCIPLCSPDGGFTGRGDGKCKDFFTESTDKKLIWQQPGS